MLSFLLAKVINVNIYSKKFGDALHHACEYKDGLTVQTLLEHGADVNSR